MFFILSVFLYGSVNKELIEAAKAGNYKRIKSLIKSGRSLHVRDTEGATPLSYAITKGHKEVASLLKSKGARL